MFSLMWFLQIASINIIYTQSNLKRNATKIMNLFWMLPYRPNTLWNAAHRAGVRQLVALFIVFKGGSSSESPGVCSPETY